MDEKNIENEQPIIANIENNNQNKDIKNEENPEIKLMEDQIDPGEIKETKQKEVIQIDELTPKSKQKIFLLVLLIFLLVIIIIIALIIFTLKDIQKEDDITVLSPLIINSTSGNHTHTIIFMPGYTNQPEDFEKFFKTEINFDKKNDTTIVILRSPLVNVSLTNSKNYSWFDIYSLPIDNYSTVNLDDLKKSAKVLDKVVNNEVNILNGDYTKIIVGGHSQGAAISLYQAYTTKEKYGGLFAFSGFLTPGDISDDKKTLPVYMGYGDKDNVITPSFINQTIEKIMDFPGFDLHIYKDHLHHICTNQTKDASIFLNNTIE